MARLTPQPPHKPGALPQQLTRSSRQEDMRFVLKVDPGTAFPELPRANAMGPNYPNPFNPETHIQFDLPLESDVDLRIYNIRGQEVAHPLRQRSFPAGHHEWLWRGDAFPSGIYFYRLSTADHNFTRKMLLLR